MALGLPVPVLVASLVASLGASLGAAPPVGDAFAIEKVKAGYGPDAREGVTVVIVDGRIAAIGAEVAIPPGALRIDGSGLTLLPGFLDGFADVAAPAPAPREERSSGGRDERPSFGSQRSAAPSGPAVSVPGNEGLAQDYGVAAYAETAEASRRGLKPETRARELLGAPDKDAEERLRNAGFVAALVAPTDGFISGQACLVELAGLPPRSSVVTEPGLLVVKFRSGEGRGRRDGDFGYPSTLMGALAHLRQSFHDAQRLRSWRDSYRRSPATVSRPPSDSCLDTLLRALDGELRVAFLVDRETDIQRALRFAEEFRLRALIVGGKEAWKCAKELAAARVPVIASLNFPDAPERKGATWKKPDSKEGKEGKEPQEAQEPEGEGAKTEAPATDPATQREGASNPEEGKPVAPPAAAAPQESAPPATTTEEAEKSAEAAPPDEAAKPEVAGPAVATDPTGTWEIPDPVLAEPLELFEQRKQEWEEEVRNVERLLAAGVQVALTTRGSNGTNDFLADLRVAIEKGLDANAALAALTTTPALLLGVEQELGTLRVGAAADLQLVEGDLTSKDRAVRHSFVAGRHFVGPKKDDAKKEGEGRGGRGRGRRGEREPEEPSEPPDRDELDLTGTWSLTSSRGEGFKSTLTLTQDGTKLTGKLESEMGSADITSGELDGDRFTITVTAQFQNRSFEFTLTGTATKDSLEGTFDTPFGEPSQFTAKRGPGAGDEDDGTLRHQEAMADGCGCGAHPEDDR